MITTQNSLQNMPSYNASMIVLQRSELFYFFPLDLVTLLPFLNFGKTIDALRLLARLFSTFLLEDIRLEIVFESPSSISISVVIILNCVRAGWSRRKPTVCFLAARRGDGTAVCCRTCVLLDIMISNFQFHIIPFIPSMVTSSFFLGCWASSSSFADRRCVRASSTGPKTRLFSATLFAFLVLARAPFAMV